MVNKMPSDEQVANHKIDSENGFRVSYDYRKNGMLEAVSPIQVYYDEDQAWKAAKAIHNDNPGRNVNISLVYHEDRKGFTCIPVLGSSEKIINEYMPQNKGKWNLA